MWSLNILARAKHRLAVLVNSIKRGLRPSLSEVFGSLITVYFSNCGTVLDKQRLLKNSRFSLVVENSDDVITEKLFDSLVNGSIPIYFGQAGLPSLLESCVIRIDSDDVRHIAHILGGLESSFIIEKLSSIDIFLRSEYFAENWAADQVYAKVVKRCEIYLSGVNFTDNSIS
jgi:hypothetical protein